ncbi:hypothetical protein OG930_38715 [Streptomyces sp. NBC_01799]|uniref:hypothetical protein n=1 Tax=Streptomyces sp. NBC_01800 TaxID=2975945 RepID=UPI002DDC0F24|nr:hypothetical protein [Streptomyces sp. NBC_01800]WSA72488.1 hypothetical protein OIE65_39330 [Streptomyces sp. NBC_01800]WSA81013.1 hypothetical protein OG930_38715 [Streptomyces sp. NBC_01799]
MAGHVGIQVLVEAKGGVGGEPFLQGGIGLDRPDQGLFTEGGDGRVPGVLRLQGPGPLGEVVEGQRGRVAVGEGAVRRPGAGRPAGPGGAGRVEVEDAARAAVAAGGRQVLGG